MSMSDVARQLVGLARAKDVRDNFVYTTDEAEREVMTLLRGQRVVPLKATREMIEAHQACCAGDADEAGPERIAECWHEMLEAAHVV
ncbi:hypothetical protein NFI95_05855 [Acetobacteraceae bacterium KSS8]|uniref:Uncharacterized protein n=1 Tax=Endosaccharibacter trunci TaxID=2812733 RepID=A0ABT1W510_9PROT|nr:hypothetical protein [Acetobacteraceae bacterium KSS8]